MLIRNKDAGLRQIGVLCQFTLGGLLLLMSAASAHAVDVIDTYGFAHIDPKGAGMFAVPIEGETYDPLSGKIGSKTTDMVATGNGPLPIVIQRNFEEIPKAYPYAFGNMSLQIPHATFDVSTGSGLDQDLGVHDLRCTNWDKNVWNDIKFYYGGGMVSLINKNYLHSNIQSLFPSDALYISKDNWYLECNDSAPEKFVVHAPDGTAFQLSLNERFATYRGGVDVTYYHSQYKIYVEKILKQGSTLSYDYEQDPAWTTSQFRAHPPLFIGYTNSNRAVIRNKHRLKTITASNASGNDPRVVTLEYYSNTANGVGECPNLIKKISSSYASNKAVNYTYRRAQGSGYGMTVDQCVLGKVIRNDGSYWDYQFGFNSQTLPFIPAGDVDIEDQRQAYIPIESITTPTGATVTYNYYTLGVCDYQDVHEDNAALNPSVHTDCPAPHYRRPAVTKRTISGDLITPMEHTIDYSLTPNPNTENVVIRSINNPERKHMLTFGRIDRYEQPTTSTANSGRRKHSGRLIKHEVLEGSIVRSTTDYQYAEERSSTNESLFIDSATIDYPLEYDDPPDDADPNFQLHAGRFKFLYDALRINLKTKTTDFNGLDFVTRWRGFNDFNQPTRIDHWYADGPDPEDIQASRTTALTYDNTVTNNQPWAIGLVTERRSGKPSDVDANTSAQIKTTRTFNAKGQLTAETDQGFTTSYTYTGWGDLSTMTDGLGRTTTYEVYYNGVPRKTTLPNGGIEWRWSYADGSVHKILDAENKRQNYRYDGLLGRLNNAWIGDTYTGLNQTAYPVWQPSSSGNTYYRRQLDYQPGRYRKYTSFDTLGRPVLIEERDLTDATKKRWQKIAYDVMGRTIFISDPSANHLGSGNWPGTSFTYDALDRVTKRKHSAESLGVRYCYGPTCTDTNGIGSVGHGYRVKDQDNNVTIYNFRALGHPSNQTVTEIIQEIGSGSDPKVITQIDRNIHDFIIKVTQDGSISTTSPSRTYEPYVKNGSTTMLVKKETHPEFGSREVTLYDNAGNMRTVSNFSGNNLTYTYTTMNQVDVISSSDGSYYANFDYFKNGMLKRAATGNSFWDYTYVTDKNLLASEAYSIDNISFPFNYTYTADNQLDTVTYPDGFVLDYDDNGFGQIKAVSFNSGSGFKNLIDNAMYFPNGQLESAGLSNGQTFSSSQNGLSLPNAWGYSKPESTDIMGLTYHYDSRRNVNWIQGYSHPYGGGVDEMEYDGLNRLTQAKGRWGTASYDYDVRGNITLASLEDYTLTYNYDNNERLSSVTRGGNILSAPAYADIDYDDNGNLTTNGNDPADGLFTLTYDEMNRMKTSTRATVLNGSVGLVNTYDANNHRTKAVVTKNSGTTTTYYLYTQSGDLLYEEDVPPAGEANGEQRHHVFFNGKSIATIGTHHDLDKDGDSIPDYFERLNGLDATDGTDAEGDSDGDGLSNLTEYQLGSSPMSVDTDGDGSPDAWEYEYELDLTLSEASLVDTDGDGVSNLDEYLQGTNPNELVVTDQNYLVPVMHQHAF